MAKTFNNIKIQFHQKTQITVVGKSAAVISELGSTWWDVASVNIRREQRQQQTFPKSSRHSDLHRPTRQTIKKSSATAFKQQNVIYVSAT